MMATAHLTVPVTVTVTLDGEPYEQIPLTHPPRDAIDAILVELVRLLGYHKAHIALFGYPPGQAPPEPEPEPVSITG